MFLISFYYILISLWSYSVLGVEKNEMILVPVLRNIKAELRPMNIYIHILKIKDIEF